MAMCGGSCGPMKPVDVCRGAVLMRGRTTGRGEDWPGLPTVA